MNVKENGEKEYSYDEFRKSRLGEKASKDFYDRQSKLQLKHLVTLEKVPRKDVILKADHSWLEIWY